MSQYKGGVHNRRTRALARLQNQLKTGKSPLDSRKLREYSKEEYNEFIELGYIPLTDKNIARIKKEIAVLASRI